MLTAGPAMGMPQQVYAQQGAYGVPGGYPGAMPGYGMQM